MLRNIISFMLCHDNSYHQLESQHLWFHCRTLEVITKKNQSHSAVGSGDASPCPHKTQYCTPLQSLMTFHHAPYRKEALQLEIFIHFKQAESKYLLQKEMKRSALLTWPLMEGKWTSSPSCSVIYLSTAMKSQILHPNSITTLVSMYLTLVLADCFHHFVHLL